MCLCVRFCVLCLVRDNAGDSARLTPDAWGTLALCILLDLIGAPGGDLDDLAWAPFSAFLLLRLFGSDVMAGLQFTKEALPFTDVIPVATLSWLLKYGFPGSELSRTLGISAADDDDKNEWTGPPK